MYMYCGTYILLAPKYSLFLLVCARCESDAGVAGGAPAGAERDHVPMEEPRFLLDAKQGVCVRPQQVSYCTH